MKPLKSSNIFSEATVPPQGKNFPVQAAKLIWSTEHSTVERNASFIFEVEFQLPKGETTDLRLALTAESRYRLWINDAWIADGPARGYPDVRYFDDVEASPFLREGLNRIRIGVTHWGVDTFQSQKADPFLLAAVYGTVEGADFKLATSGDWRVRRAVEWGQDVPRISCQLGFEEYEDAREIPHSWSKACVLKSHQGAQPFSLERRATGMLGRKYRALRNIVAADQVEPISGGWTLGVRELLSPAPRGSNLNGMAGVFATTIRAAEDTEARLYFIGPVQGVNLRGEPLKLQCEQDLWWCDVKINGGDNWLTVAVCTEYDHAHELSIGYRSVVPLEWLSSGAADETPWLSSGPLWTTAQVSNCFIDKCGKARPPREPFVPSFGGEFASDYAHTLLVVQDSAAASSFPDWKQRCEALIQTVKRAQISQKDAYFSLRTDQAVSQTEINSADSLPVDLPSDSSRLLLDLDDMTIGYFHLSFEAPEGTIVDGFFFENLEQGDEGKPAIQYLEQNGISYRNSFRYVARSGRNEFVSRHRRGFRFAQLVFRNSAVRIHRAGVFEATYAPEQQSYFQCSDQRLTRIHEMSQRTLLLCMEDTFTDCPTYEQTFWVGDARNEALFGCVAFGSYDLAWHCASIAALSLRQLPLIASQCPSGWNAIIPSFSFLWGLSVWDIYQQTGDLERLREIYPAVKTNLEVALRYCVDHGLFSAPTWNFLDWTSIDQNQETVLHNSMLLAAALQSAIQCSDALEEPMDRAFFQQHLTELVEAINLQWDNEKEAYPDAILPGGNSSPHFSQHTSFLAILFNIIPDHRRAAAVLNCVRPSPETTRVGSPNSLFFLLEAMVKVSASDQAMALLLEFWGKMLARDAKTGWEMINQQGAAFPTRSHCHGWSSSPVYLLPKILFGLEILEPGWKKVSISPFPANLDYAESHVCTPYGLLKMKWERQPDGELVTEVDAPEKIEVTVHGL